MQDIRAAIYVRVSTTKASQKDSPEHQNGICLEKAREIGLEIPYPPYEDRDTGTSILSRPAIQQLIEDAKKGRFRTILFASLSRFSRDTYDSLGLKRILVDTLGIRLISLDENYDSSVDRDEFKFQIISAVNQKLSEQISLSSKRGIRQSALKGNFTGSITPYGYIKVVEKSRKTLVPNEETMNHVKLIYHLYINEKMGDKAIVNYLNKEQIPSYRGGKWGLSSIQRLLTNEVYTGQNVFSKYESKQVYFNIQNMSERGKKLVQRKEDEWERSSFITHEAIIDTDTFRRAQEIRFIRGGGKIGGRKASVNVFAGIIYCKHCGSAIVSMKSKSKNADYRYLMCSRRRRQGETACDNGKWIPYNEFRDRLIQEISLRLQNMVDVEKIIEHYSENLQVNERTDDIKETKKYTKMLEENRKLLFEIRKQKMLDEIDEKQYIYEKEMYEKEILRIQEKLEIIKNNNQKLVNRDVLVQEIKSAIQELLKLKCYDNVDATKLILKKLIQRITIQTNGEIEIYTPIGTIQ